MTNTDPRVMWHIEANQDESKRWLVLSFVDEDSHEPVVSLRYTNPERLNGLRLELERIVGALQSLNTFGYEETARTFGLDLGLCHVDLIDTDLTAEDILSAQMDDDLTPEG